jgi:integrase
VVDRAQLVGLLEDLLEAKAKKKKRAKKRKRATSHATEALTWDQLLGVFERARAHRERDWILFLLAFTHGLRASEAVALTPGHFSDGFLTVARKKGSMRTVQELVQDPNPLLDERAAVAAWLSRCGAGPGDFLFPISRIQFWRLFHKYCLLAGVPAHLAHPHTLKHTCGMLNIDAAGIHHVRQWLGHRSISSTGEYLKVGDPAAGRAIAAARRGRPPDGQGSLPFESR